MRGFFLSRSAVRDASPAIPRHASSRMRGFFLSRSAVRDASPAIRRGLSTDLTSLPADGLGQIAVCRGGWTQQRIVVAF
jgi:hypothetical protein